MLLTLRDRVEQVREFATSCTQALSKVHDALFPLNDQPQGLAALMTNFRHGNAIRDFVRHQLIAGATAALAFVHLHHPRLDLHAIGAGLPWETMQAGPIDMRPYYEAAEGPANCIVALVKQETDLELDRRTLGPPKEEQPTANFA